MKKVLMLVFFIVIISFVNAENLYQYDSLELKLNVQGELNLIAEESGARVNSVKAELMLFPEDSFRQKILSWESEGELKNNNLVFEWQDKQLGKKTFGFEAGIKTEDKRIKINQKIPFPLNIQNHEEYLQKTEHIDKDNPKIIAKAAELAEGEDDLFRAVFKLAKWVEENIEYELNTLTTGVSQKASWVLENKEGACDEITSLFLAMCRTLGIPAKFISGVSYTTLELFEENWLPHGWAEVYFPDYGWISFDITFGEYGYVDATHIKLSEGPGPKKASTKFEWVGNKVKLEAEKLNFGVEIEKKGALSEEEISFEEEILGEEVDLGSYNLVKGIIKNKEDHYAAATLKLAAPNEIEIIGEKTKIILLEPNEIKEVSWLIKIKEDLPKAYWYEFPMIIYSEKNISTEKRFKAMKGGIFYSKEEAESLMPKEEEKRLLGKVNFDCDYKKEIKLGEKNEIACTIKNKGNVNLKEINFCLGPACKIINLPINQEDELKMYAKGKEVGWQKLIISAENEQIIKKSPLTYVVLDDPETIIEAESPGTINYDEEFTITLKIGKDSFSIPEKIKVILKGAGFENTWEMEKLKEEQEFMTELNSKNLGRKNKFRIKLLWEDKSGKKFEKEKTILIQVKGENFWEKIILWFNGILSVFT